MSKLIELPEKFVLDGTEEVYLNDNLSDKRTKIETIAKYQKLDITNLIFDGVIDKTISQLSGKKLFALNENVEIPFSLYADSEGYYVGVIGTNQAHLTCTLYPIKESLIGGELKTIISGGSISIPLVQNSDLDSLNQKLEELLLFKFPNVTIFGEPLINNGQISGFSAANYAQFPFLVDFHQQAFEINMCFTTGNSVISQENIFDSLDGLAFAVRNGNFVIAMSSDGQSWDMGEHIGTFNVSPKTTYYVKFSWNKLQYKLQVSTDKNTYIDDILVTNTKSLFAKQIIIGKATNDASIFDGSINLNYCSLSIMGQQVWQGMDDVGIATRLATDLSNIDEAGIEKIKEITKGNFEPLKIVSVANVNAGGYQVPQLTVEDVTNSFNAIVNGKAVIITDKDNTMHAFVNQADNLNGEKSIGILYYSYALLTYTLIGNNIEITVKEIK